MSHDLIVLLNDQILSLDVRVRGLQLRDGCPLLRLVLLVQVHSEWKHLFHITDSDWHAWGDSAAVDLNSRWVRVGEAPDPQVLDQVVQVATSLPMKRLVLVLENDWDVDQVRSADDVTLEVDVVRQASEAVVMDLG